ncbi:MAG: sigma 54-interacting transcriptional regulator [Deltaproteobacteria bacterium]|nr:sigma 54-interacting transcriptional regulator [Deltaproteobacteria bacterium]
MSSSTVRQPITSVPIRGLRVRVVAGADAGKVVRAAESTISIGASPDNDLVLADETVSRYHAELRTEGDRILIVDLGSTNGTFVNGVRIERGSIESGTKIGLGRVSLVAEGEDPIDVALPEAEQLGHLRGRSPAMRRLLADIERVAHTSASVILIGETGSGKEAVAEAIHAGSARAAGPLEIVDCGVLAPSLIASELFGHERGAFTGAETSRTGAFERAHGGTLFLDEIGELPLALQASLLGVLERRAFKRLGGDKMISVDVRVLAATNRDLRAEVNAARFRQDLFFRLAVVTLRIPPLRERVEDVPLLIEHFLRLAGYSGDVSRVVPDSVLPHLIAHRWAGNVRELRNFVEAALAMGVEGALPLAADPLGSSPDLASSTPTIGATPATGATPAPGATATFLRHPLPSLFALEFKDARESIVRDFELAYVRELLRRTGGNVTHAARVSGIHRSYLNLLIKRHRLRSD